MNIPITFDHQGKTYTGYFQEVQKAGNYNVYHLMIDGYYRGRLRFSDRWCFDSTPKVDFSDLAEFFGEYVSKY